LEIALAAVFGVHQNAMPRLNEQQLNELGSQGRKLVAIVTSGGYFGIYLKLAK